MGGHVAFYTEQGIGTEFKIYLPALRRTGRLGRDGDAQLQAPLPRGTERILVVEDEPTLREVAAAVLADLATRSPPSPARRRRWRCRWTPGPRRSC